jgi:hypothetical protein
METSMSAPDPQPFRAPLAPDPSFDEDAATRAANRFDIRRIIGVLFAVYGIVLIALGLLGSHHVKVKASGINIDLWTGLGMVVVAALMLGWALSRPVSPQPPEERGLGSGRIRRAPAT